MMYQMPRINLKTSNMQCVLCDGPLDDQYGNNAEPVSKGKCCNICNATVVIPARINRVIKAYDQDSEN